MGYCEQACCSYCPNFVQDGVLPQGLNDTTIILIPKRNDPEELTKRNVLFKFISKCIVNRLRGIHDDVVCQEQSASVPNRRITDNAVIASSCDHAI
jgi:hypothetical protein